MRTNENEVLRVNLNGAGGDTNYIMEKQYNAAGRLQLIAGNLLVTYDPNDPTRDGTGFYTDTALSKIPNADSNTTTFAVNGGTTHQGFIMGNANNNTSSLLLTKPGQHFNMAAWTATGSGIKFVGGLNESGEVRFGSSTATNNLSIAGAALRLYAAAGGSVVFDHRITGNPGTAPNNIGILKVGRGNVTLRNSTNATAGDSNFQISGGKLILDHSGQNVALVGGGSSGNAIFSGGVVHAQSNLAASTTIGYALTSAANNVLQIQNGTSEIIAEGRGTRTMTVNIGNTNANNNRANVTRASGGAVNFVEAVTGNGNGVITLNFNNFTNSILKNRVVSWATYSNTPREALDFAMVDAGAPVANRIKAVNRVASEYVNDVAGWANWMDVSENGGAGFFGTLTNSKNLNTLRFDTMADSVVTIGSGTTLSLVGDGIAGGLLVSSNTGASNKTITGGSIAAATLSYQGGTTINNSVITGVTNTAGLQVGMPISGNGIPAGAYITAINGNSITISANATATASNVPLTTATPEIVIHQYGKGKLTIASSIVGDTDLTIAGPSTTSPENFGTTGVVKLTGNNTYTGQTFVNGAVLEFSSMSALGNSPTTFTNNHLTLNGGTVRWTGGVASLGNRGVMLQGDGGVFDIANASGNLVIGGGLTVANGLNSQEIFRGDLVKTGAGALTLLGTHANFQGLMDVRQGSLVVVSDVGNAAAGTVSVLGSNRSWADGTILRQGTNLQMFLGNANNSGDWNIEEFFTFEGNNTFTYGGLLDINANLASDGVLSGSQFNMGNRRPLNLNGIMDIKGTTTFDVANFGILRLNNNTGYLTGSGDIVKDGGGRMEFRSNVPEWKGGLVIKQGTVWAANQADVIGTGYASGKTITLGDTERAGLAEFMIYSPDNPSIQGWIFDINHDINVTYNPLQTKRLGIESTANDSVTAYNGNITLNDNLVLIMRDSVNMPVGGEQFYVQFNGRLKDGATTSGNILVQTDETSGTANDAATARTYGYAVLNGDNSAWTGDITISNNAAYNHDSTSILRLGNAKALTAANDVTMNFNSILQAGGQNVIIGNLNTAGGTGAFFGNSGSMSSSGSGSSEIIENASATPAVLTITQSTPSTYEAIWDAFFRDGTINSRFFAPGANVLQPSASLGVTKSGNGWATLSLDNDYTGPTVVQQGILQVGRNGIGDTGKSPSISNPNMMTTVMNGATIAGSGIVQGKLAIQSGGILSTGDQAGKAIGTLFVSGDVMLASGSQALLQLRNATYNNPGALTATDQNYSFWRDHVLTDEFSPGLNSMVTGSQHDMLTASGTINWAPGAKIMVQNDGYTPKAGDIFRLFKGSGYLGTVNVGPVLRKGGDDLTIPNLDLILFALGGNLMWDTSLFNSAGILMVVEADTAVQGVPPPAFTQAPSADIDLSQRLTPGTSVTLSALAETPGSPQTPVTYQWYLDESPVLGATSASYTFEANFATKGEYSVAASNAGGTTIHPDKLEVLVDDVPEITTNPSSATVAPNSSHTFGVQSRGQAPFTYQWYKNDVAIQGATGQFYSLTNIQEADEGTYHVVVTNSVASVTSEDATLDVIDEITSVVASVTPADAYLGQEIRFSVVHDGEGNVTYQWRRNGSNISGATSATYVIPSATAAADGSYTVAVTNEVDTKVSNAITLALQNPVVTIVTPPQSRTLLSGQSLDLKVVARGLPTLRYAWKKNNAVLANVFTADISKLNENGTGAALTDGGTYTVEVSNAQSKASTIANPAEVVVVDSTNRYLPVAEKGVATLTPVIAAGPKTPLSYKWVRIGTRTVMDPGPDMIPGNDDDVPLEEETETELVSGSGVGQASVKAYKITGVTAVANNGFYRLKVTGPDGVTVTGNQYELRVFTDLPQFKEVFAFDTALIGRDYRFQVPVKRDDTTIWPDKITAAGLPPGLKIDPISGVITGKPTATKVGGYKVTITLANKFGKVTSTGTLNVLDLNQTVPGTWVGVVGRNAALGDNLGGRVDLTVTSKATFTGKLLLGGTTYSFAGPLNVNTVPYTGSVYIKRAGKPVPDPLRLDFALDPVSNRLTAGLITDGVTNLSFTGWRQIFNKVLTASTYVGYYTMAVGLSDSDPLYTANPNGTKNVPLGAGYASFTVAADGKLTVAGKMPDGETLTNATFVGPDGELAVFQHMYKALKPGGSLLGQFKIDDKVTIPDLDPGNEDNTIEGSATWVRPASTKATDRTFKAGFGLPGTAVTTPITVVASGGRYVAPASGFSVLNIPEPLVGATPANNAEIDFINGGDLGYAYVSFGTSFVSMDPDVRVYVIKGSKVTVLSSTENEAKTALTAVPKTGLLSGSFTTKDFSPIYPVKPEFISRSVKFQGVIIKETGDGGQPSYVGVGYFLLPQLPKQSGETDKTTPFYSGRFVFEKL
ncbi:MAG TPA: immunoglobulin domain-containing protein [Prosthecobacter sp.]